MANTNVDSAAGQTLKAVAMEFGAPGRLSADIVASTDSGEPVISVINLDTNEHWHLVVKALPLAQR